MNAAETLLWAKIEAFKLDNPEAGFKFSTRLARENGWSLSYTNRVIDEYKKFIFLCCISGSGVTPSDPVDQAWHLHLTYTRSYWIDLCQNTIGQNIHHNPTKGGGDEAKKFNKYYTAVKDIYQQHFNMFPPADIWHNNQRRFKEINFQRVNMDRYWLIKKPRFTIYSAVAVMLLVILAVFVQATDSLFAILFMLGVVSFVTVAVYRHESDPNRSNKGDNRDNSGSGGCGGDSSWDHSSHHGGHDSDGHGGDSGCGSGCSGCSSGCSGCGGGGD